MRLADTRRSYEAIGALVTPAGARGAGREGDCAPESVFSASSAATSNSSSSERRREEVMEEKKKGAARAAPFILLPIAVKRDQKMWRIPAKTPSGSWPAAAARRLAPKLQ